MQTVIPRTDNPDIEKKFKILMVIDDSLPDRFIAEKLISRTNLTKKLLIKDSAINALSYFSENMDVSDIPDVILLDIRMPEMDGFEFLEKFNSLPDFIKNTCKIYMLTSSAYTEDKRRAVSYPYVVGYVTKPLTDKVLKEVFE